MILVYVAWLKKRDDRNGEKAFGEAAFEGA
jgi:hypothetical protein